MEVNEQGQMSVIDESSHEKKFGPWMLVNRKQSEKTSPIRDLPGKGR